MVLEEVIEEFAAREQEFLHAPDPFGQGKRSAYWEILNFLKNPQCGKNRKCACCVFRTVCDCDL